VADSSEYTLYIERFFVGVGKGEGVSRVFVACSVCGLYLYMITIVELGV
jgi:hypothetical protein